MNYFNQESENLIYRKLTEADIESWTAFFKDNDRLAFLGLDLAKDHETLSKEWVWKQLDRYETQGFGHLALIEKASGNLVGMAGIIPRELNTLMYEIGYSFKPSSWGKGYATEAARQMKRFGLENGVADAFISIIHKENTASMNVARKNGMEMCFEMQFMGMDVFVYGDPVYQPK